MQLIAYPFPYSVLGSHTKRLKGLSVHATSGMNSTLRADGKALTGGTMHQWTLSALKFESDLNAAVSNLTTQLGSGHSESVYQKGLLAVLRSMNYQCESERHIGVTVQDTKGVVHVLSHMKVDIIVHPEGSSSGGVYVLELKCADRADTSVKDQLRRYVSALRADGVTVSMVFHVQFPKYCWRQSKDPRDRRFEVNRIDMNDFSTPHSPEP